MALVELVYGAVGKKTAVGIDSSCGEAAARGDEHPKIGVAGNADQKWLHVVIGDYAIVDFAIQLHKPALG